jgi:hypothetical protein
MSGIKLNKKIFGGIIVLILIGVVVGYYKEHHEGKEVADSIKNRRSNNDSATPSSNDSVTRINREKTPTAVGVKPEINTKDGSVKIIEEFIKLNAKNPATFKFLEWSDVQTEGGYWKVRCKYSGVSSFNAEVTTNAWFYIRNNQVVHTKIISKI